MNWYSVTKNSARLPKLPEDFDAKIDVVTQKCLDGLKYGSGFRDFFIETFMNPYGDGTVEVGIKLITEESDVRNMMLPDSIEAKDDGGYRVDIVLSFGKLYKHLLVAVKKAIEDPEMIALKEKDPTRFGVLTYDYLIFTNLRRVVAHELAHAFDPDLVLPVLKTRSYRNIDYYQEDGTVDLGKWAVNENEMKAEFLVGFKKLRDIISRSIELGYSDQIKSNIYEGLERLKNTEVTFSGLNSLIDIPIEIINRLDARRGKLWRLRTFNMLRDTLGLFPEDLNV